MLIWLYDPSLMNVLFIISVAIHLLGDLLPMFKKKGGFSCIDIFGFKRLNTIWSMVWFFGNIILSIILFIMVI